MSRQIAILGGDGILTVQDLPALSAGTKRVLKLMRDRQWHSATEIVETAQGSEGLRRLRELRRHGYTVERRRIEGSRLFEYRMR